MSEANDSEGGRTSQDSCCAMNKERVGSNGCEKVSTHMKTRGEKESSSPSQWRYRLGVRMDGSQPFDRGSNPRSATTFTKHIAFSVYN